MGRVIAGVIAGLGVAMAAIWCIEMVNHLIHPVPADVRMSDPARLERFVLGLPIGAQLFVAGGWFVGALIGGWVAGAISRRGWAVWLIAILVAIAGIANLLYVAHPLLLQIAAIVAPLLGGLAAAALLRRTPSAGMEGRP